MRRSFIRASMNSQGDETHIQAFVNITSNPVGIRASSSHEDSEKTSHSVLPGQPVVVQQVEEKDGIRFLKLADGRGWLFDSKDNVNVMAKMEELEVGTAWYRVACKQLVDVRIAPVYDISARTGRLLCPGEVVSVDMKCRICGSHFAHLADGRGWVFLLMFGANRKNPHSSHVVLTECEGEIDKNAVVDPINDLIPTNDVVDVGNWTYIVGHEPVLAIGSVPYGTYLKPGDVFLVNKRAYAKGDAPGPHQRGVMWLRLNDGRGWVPMEGTRGEPLVRLQKESAITYPKHFNRRMKDLDSPSAPWMTGVA